jgi:hypothetical protein
MKQRSTIRPQARPGARSGWPSDVTGPACLSVESMDGLMEGKQTAQRAVVTTGVAGAVAVAIRTTPEARTQLAVGVISVAASSLVLLVLFRTPWLRSAPPQRLRWRIWFAAACTALLAWAFFWIPLVTKHPTVRLSPRAALGAGSAFCSI